MGIFDAICLIDYNILEFYFSKGKCYNERWDLFIETSSNRIWIYWKI
jgi:hypothetical protein